MKENLPKIIEDASIMILYLDQHQNIILSNKKFQTLIGVKNASILGKNWLNVLFRSPIKNIKKDMFNAVMNDSVTYKRAKDFECHILNSLGKICFISWSINPLLDKNNKVEAITLFGHDITEIKERENSKTNIDDSLRSIFNSIKEYALYVINLEGNIIYFGMGASTMLGWSKEDIIFKHASLLHNSYVDSTELAGILKQTKLLGKYETETELITKDLHIIPVMLTVNQFLDAQGKPSGFIFMAKDITEKKKLEYQIFQAEKLTALGQLSAGMAHEINNPLFVISGRLEILKQEELNTNVKSTLSLIGAQTDRIRNLVDRILKYARKTALILEPVDINKTLESVLPWVYYSKLPNAEVIIEKTLGSDLPKIAADPHQLTEVFLNILINAYQSMPNGGRISITTNKINDHYIQIQIADSGAGIPAHQLKNIFMPFFTTKKEGLGLGLSICHNIIKSHNGTIELNSQINQGTTFTIKFPFI